MSRKKVGQREARKKELLRCKGEDEGWLDGEESEQWQGMRFINHIKAR